MKTGNIKNEDVSPAFFDSFLNHFTQFGDNAGLVEPDPWPEFRIG